MKENTGKNKTTKRVVLSVMSVLTVFLVIGFVSLNAVGGVDSLHTFSSAVQTAQDLPLLFGTQTSGGTQEGVEVRQTFTIHQDQYGQVFNDLHFKVWQKEDNIDINGWRVIVSHFTESSSARGSQPPEEQDPDNGLHAVDVDIEGADINYCTHITIDITLWLTNYNTMRICDFYWTIDGVNAHQLPDQGWTVSWPNATPNANATASRSSLNTSKGDDVYSHKLTIANDDAKKELKITGLKYFVSMDKIDDLKKIDFSGFKPVSDFVLPPKKSNAIEILTDKPYYGGHIYFEYNVIDTSAPGEPVFRSVRADHPITEEFPSAG